MRMPFARSPSRPSEPASVYHEQPPLPGAQPDSEPGGPGNDAPPGRARSEDRSVDLERLRDQLTARVAELQWDLGGLAYEMAIRDQVRVDILVKRAAMLQDADAELGEVERILRTELTGAAGTCAACGAPHSSGAVFCWQCGQSLLEQVSGDSIVAP